MHKKYFTLYSIAVVALIALHLVLKFLKPNEVQWQIDLIVCGVFYALLSPPIYFFGRKGLESKNNRGFINFFYGSFMIKLFLSIGFVLSYLSFIKHVQWSFIVTFGCCYFLFSGIETACLMIQAKTKID